MPKNNKKSKGKEKRDSLVVFFFFEACECMAFTRANRKKNSKNKKNITTVHVFTFK